MKSLAASSKYKAFMAGRDKALEQLLNKYLLHMGRVMAVLEKKSVDIARMIAADGFNHYDFKRKRDQFERQLSPWFEMGIEELTALITRLRQTTYLLSYAGQTEGIARATSEFQAMIPGQHVKRWEQKHADMPSGGTVKMRVELVLHRLLRDVLDAFQLSQVMASGKEEDRLELIDRIKRAFPKRVEGKKRKLLAKIQEADRPGLNDSFLSFGIIEPQEWKQIVEDYFSEEFPPNSPNRTIYSDVFYSDAPDDPGRYEWEIEKEVGQDFVQQVRDGENDAANAQGIIDFQWISIIDNKTDDCCIWRDGLTSKEIEEALDNDHSDDECDATVPPAHFYCRCRLVPMTDDLQEVKQSNLMDFETWLNTRQ